ncbi:Short chain dehydrogenase [Endozoicomonas sp. OPT23]|uniref:SDR family oxidoreductase n=1 Tax=Endozoicomonas sp. OPT23 TaxID=2072845 RepID=UPI00129BEB3B|nr:SDR family oxidoreductase [Endozoicomonas sp. OPT23]MRI34034.1 Short chain dehydrogenase [Endozoicomonas sp. OPT23]
MPTIKETAVITGANRGLGLEFVRQMLNSGYKVIATCRQPDDAEELYQLAGSGSLTVLPLEVDDPHSVDSFIKAMDEQPVDILVNNAGVMGAPAQDIDNMEVNLWLKLLRVNTIAPFELTTRLLPNLRMSDRPRVIAMSSQMGALNSNGEGFYAYRSSKAALNKVMQTLAIQLAKEHIIVCPVLPGWVQTDMGGKDADISVDESVKGMMRLLENLSLEQSGQFLTWHGTQHTW